MILVSEDSHGLDRQDVLQILARQGRREDKILFEVCYQICHLGVGCLDTVLFARQDDDEVVVVDGISVVADMDDQVVGL